jgi:hypothetical protein
VIEFARCIGITADIRRKGFRSSRVRLVLYVGSLSFLAYDSMWCPGFSRVRVKTDLRAQKKIRVSISMCFPISRG